MRLKIRLISDTAFGRGDGITGVVDSEVEHDKETGLPLVKGRTLKGLLVEACADLLYSLEMHTPALATELENSAARLFGQPGSTIEDTGSLHVGRATLPDDLIQTVQNTSFSPPDVLAAMTAIRHQTAVERKTGKPSTASLRATRTVIRETVFLAPLTITGFIEEVDLDLLAACAATVRRAGKNRTRGIGRIECTLDNVDTDYLSRFIKRVENAS